MHDDRRFYFVAMVVMCLVALLSVWALGRVGVDQVQGGLVMAIILSALGQSVSQYRMAERAAAASRDAAVKVEQVRLQLATADRQTAGDLREIKAGTIAIHTLVNNAHLLLLKALADTTAELYRQTGKAEHGLAASRAREAVRAQEGKQAIVDDEGLQS